MLGRFTMRRMFAAAMLGLLVWVKAGAAESAPDDGDAQDASPVLELIYHGDLDGRFAQPDCLGGRGQAASYPRLVGLLGRARAAATTTGGAPVALLAGNLAAPDLLGLSLLEQGEPGIDRIGKLLARGGYDVVALGHHDLALEPSRLRGLVEALDGRGLPVVVSNLTCERERAALCERTRRELLVRRGPVTVGILATISPSVTSGLPAESRAGLRLDEVVPVVRAGTRRLRERGATYVVLMAQGPRDRRGLDEVDILQRALGTGTAGVGHASTGTPAPDVILAGGLADEEANRALEVLRRQDAPPVLGGPTGPLGLARISLSGTQAGSSVEVRVEQLRVTPPNAPATAVDADGESAALLAPAIAGFCREFDQQLSPAPVRGAMSRDDFVRYGLEIMRRRAGAEIALVNRALVKAAPFPIVGPITRGQLYAALPYKTVVGSARVTGAALSALLGPALANPKAATVGLARKGSELQVNGRAVDKARSYRVATISFVASGGDDILDGSGMPWRPLPDEPDLRALIADFLRTETGHEDGDPTVDPRTDFGPVAAHRLLVVGLSDGGLDFVDTRIANGPEYGDAQLTRGKQQMWKAEWTGLVQTRHPRHESDSRLNLKYGWTRSQPAGGAASSTETTDLVTLTSVYNYRGLRTDPAGTRRYVPDPYLRVGLESELTRPALSATQTRTYHHFELTNTAGALFTLTPAIKLRGGAGVRKELLTSTAPAGRWRPVLEAGGTLAPTALATVGPLPVRAEGLVDYSYVDPADAREHQLRASGKLSVPLLPLLFITVGLDVFAVQRQQQGWAASYDTTIGLRVHLDSALQLL